MILFLTIILLIAYVLLFRHYAKGWRKSGTGLISSKTPSVFASIIIAARNEAENLPALLHSLDSQQYPKEVFEVIIVDDHSTDNSKQIISAAGLPNVRVISLDEDLSSKKKAIEKGIGLSQGELVITTDADCILPPNWLTALTDFYKEKDAAFVAAPVKFLYNTSFLQKFQAIDFMMLQGITVAGIALDLHYMCNGANLAFAKKAFLQVNGYKGIDRIATGDDMLLMHKIKKSFPSGVHFLKHAEAIVSTAPMQTWKEFFMQRKRWASKTLVYEDWRIIAILAFVYFFNIWFFVLLVTGFYIPVYFLYAVMFLMIKSVAEWNFLKQVAAFFKDEKLLKYLFIYQPVHIFYTVFVGAWSQLGKYEWKGRITK